MTKGRRGKKIARNFAPTQNIIVYVRPSGSDLLKTRPIKSRQVNYLASYPDLPSAPLLKSLPEDQISDFLQACMLREYKKPTVLASQGTESPGVFLILQGKVEVAFTSEHGYRAILRHADEYQLLGTTEVLAQRKMMATLTAFAASTVLFCDAKDFTALAERPGWMRPLADIGYQHLRQAREAKVIDQFFTAEQRICRYLQDFAGPSLVFSQSQSYLANAVGCTRQTVNKELSTLKDLDVIRIAKSEVRILNLDGLNARIEELEQRRNGGLRK